MKKLIIGSLIVSGLFGNCEFTYDDIMADKNHKKSLIKYFDKRICLNGAMRSYYYNKMQFIHKSKILKDQWLDLEFKIFEAEEPLNLYKIATVKKGQDIKVNCIFKKNHDLENCKTTSNINLPELKEKIVYVDKIIYKEKECPKVETVKEDLEKMNFESFKSDYK